MQMTIGRRLAEAVGSWLHMEFCCYRGEVVVLAGFDVADFPHDAINPNKRKGRKKEVDFALILTGKGLPHRNAEVIVEAKWSNSSHCTPDSIFNDLLRLAALKKMDPDAKCIFLLAGHTRSFTSTTSGMPFFSGGKSNKGVGNSKYGNSKRIKLSEREVMDKNGFSTQIKEIMNDGIIIPDSFVSTPCPAHPIQSKSGTVDFQAQCWEITEISKTDLNPNHWIEASVKSKGIA